MSRAARPDEGSPYATALDRGIRAAFAGQGSVLTGWRLEPASGAPHSYHVSAAGEAAGVGFGLIADAAEGAIEIVSLLGHLQPTADPGVVLHRLNEAHAAVVTGRFLLATDPPRLIYEAELLVGPGDDQAALVERLLPILLREMAGVVAEELPHLIEFLTPRS